ncbi:MAG TPA: M48 family metalloprotease [Longimicrobiaceae bacterium]|nr:M48 family metalloprotease [Longimicrobiaceae bacterium]
MPRVLLLIAILVLIALAVRSMLRALLELRLGRFEPPRGDGEPEVSAEIPGDPYAWIHERLMEAYAGEREGWALDQARRIDARLQADVPEGQRLETVILWAPEAGAFTMPGRFVYLSRRLQERVMNDDQLAFVIAHEIAHQRLGQGDRTGEAGPAATWPPSSAPTRPSRPSWTASPSGWSR